MSDFLNNSRWEICRYRNVVSGISWNRTGNKFYAYKKMRHVVELSDRVEQESRRVSNHVRSLLWMLTQTKNLFNLKKNSISLYGLHLNYFEYSINKLQLLIASTSRLFCYISKRFDFTPKMSLWLPNPNPKTLLTHILSSFCPSKLFFVFR